MMQIRVLVVDDHDVARQVMCSIVERCKTMEVVGAAGSGKEALLAIGALQPDVVVLDKFMPGVDGFGVLEALKVVDTKPKVVMLSVDDAPESEREAMNRGANAFVAKMAAHQELLDTIIAVMDGSQGMDGSQPVAKS